VVVIEQITAARRVLKLQSHVAGSGVNRSMHAVGGHKHTKWLMAALKGAC
jgi:hypothetical protein